MSQALLGAATTALALWPAMMVWVNWAPGQGWGKPADTLKPTVYAALLGAYTLVSRLVSGEGGDRAVTWPDLTTAAIAAVMVAVVGLVLVVIGRLAWEWLKGAQK